MFPIMLNIRGRKCTVAGGGNVAERKVKTLLKYGADVTAVSPVLPPSVTPEALSTNVVVVDVPSTAPAVVACPYLMTQSIPILYYRHQKTTMT